MPYKRVGKTIYKQLPSGRWTIKQVATSVENAIKALRVLRSLE